MLDIKRVLVVVVISSVLELGGLTGDILSNCVDDVVRLDSMLLRSLECSEVVTEERVALVSILVTELIRLSVRDCELRDPVFVEETVVSKVELVDGVMMVVPEAVVSDDPALELSDPVESIEASLRVVTGRLLVREV